MLTTFAAAVLSASTAAHAADHAESVEAMATALEDTYVFPDVGAECAALLREQLASGAYDGLDEPHLAQKIHEQLRGITQDGHLRVGFAPSAPQSGAGGGFVPPPNHGFVRVETLRGNIGYLDFRFFEDSEGARATTDAAMRFLRDSDAVIVDLRKNGGGAPEAVRYVCSYFFGDEPVHLNSIYDRTTGETAEFWTLESLPEHRLDDVPVYVLTSSNTFSGAEEMTYNLRTRERATIVGETTGGGAHPTMGVDAVDGFVISVPYARAINPITGTNWEGAGIDPDVTADAAHALETAHLLALEKLSASADGVRATRLAWARDHLRASTDPLRLDEQTLRAYEGSYGPRKVTLRDGVLYYSRGDNPERPLHAIANDTFMIDGIDFCKLVFETDDSGEAARIVGYYDAGHTDVTERD